MMSLEIKFIENGMTVSKGLGWGVGMGAIV